MPTANVCGSIPAWAGEPLDSYELSEWMAVYPRVGGGTRLSVTPYSGGKRSIPAWAGEPYVRRRFRIVGMVYPRVGGGTRFRWWVD